MSINLGNMMSSLGVGTGAQTAPQSQAQPQAQPQIQQQAQPQEQSQAQPQPQVQQEVVQQQPIYNNIPQGQTIQQTIQPPVQPDLNMGYSQQPIAEKPIEVVEQQMNYAQPQPMDVNVQYDAYGRRINQPYQPPVAQTIQEYGQPQYDAYGRRVGYSTEYRPRSYSPNDPRNYDRFADTNVYGIRRGSIRSIATLDKNATQEELRDFVISNLGVDPTQTIDVYHPKYANVEPIHFKIKDKKGLIAQKVEKAIQETGLSCVPFKVAGLNNFIVEIMGYSIAEDENGHKYAIGDNGIVNRQKLDETISRFTKILEDGNTVDESLMMDYKIDDSDDEVYRIPEFNKSEIDYILTLFKEVGAIIYYINGTEMKIAIGC